MAAGPQRPATRGEWHPGRRADGPAAAGPHSGAAAGREPGPPTAAAAAPALAALPPRREDGGRRGDGGREGRRGRLRGERGGEVRERERRWGTVEGEGGWGRATGPRGPRRGGRGGGRGPTDRGHLPRPLRGPRRAWAPAWGWVRRRRVFARGPGPDLNGPEGTAAQYCPLTQVSRAGGPLVRGQGAPLFPGSSKSSGRPRTSDLFAQSAAGCSEFCSLPRFARPDVLHGREVSFRDPFLECGYGSRCSLPFNRRSLVSPPALRRGNGTGVWSLVLQEAEEAFGKSVSLKKSICPIIKY